MISQVNKKLGHIRERNNIDSYALVPLDFMAWPHEKRQENVGVDFAFHLCF